VINIEVNGQKLELNDGAALRDALEAAKAFYFPGTTAGILKTGTKKEEATSEYKILTTKGEFRIELAGNMEYGHGSIVNSLIPERTGIHRIQLPSVLWKQMFCLKEPGKNTIVMMYSSGQGI